MVNIKYRLNSSWESVFNAIYPVGSVYMSSNSTSPANRFGGTWASLSDGRFLRPSTSWNAQGGENTHVLTLAEMPTHLHSGNDFGNAQVEAKGYGLVVSGGFINRCLVTRVAPANDVHTDSQGSGVAHNNIPAYRTVYCWYRTA